MKKKIISTLAVLTIYAPLAWAADNEIFVDQNGATSNIDLEQLGSGNIIGGLNSTAGSLTAFDLDGTSLTLDINQIGSWETYTGIVLLGCLNLQVIVIHSPYKQTQQQHMVLIHLITM